MAHFVFKCNKEDYLSQKHSHSSFCRASHQRWHTLFLSVMKKMVSLFVERGAASPEYKTAKILTFYYLIKAQFVIYFFCNITLRESIFTGNCKHQDIIQHPTTATSVHLYTLVICDMYTKFNFIIRILTCICTYHGMFHTRDYACQRQKCAVTLKRFGCQLYRYVSQV